GHAEREVRHWTSHDRLTELANRTLFHERLTDALAASRRDGRDKKIIVERRKRPAKSPKVIGGRVGTRRQRSA
ncbi:GGDEF domain-containing protein, partial [Frankia gtarii]|uniref:GGDEF domain-containing protein n=1 Tax=Frankia gtarii TaxID=2950102 RepID=UPI0021BF2B32